MRSFVPVLFTTLILTQAGFSAPPPNEAQYIYGTVKQFRPIRSARST